MVAAKHGRKTPIKLRLPDYGVLAAESIHLPGFIMEPEAHGFYELYYLVKGSMTYFEESPARRLELKGGMFFAISKGVTHWLEDAAQGTLLLLCFSAEYLEERRERLELWSRLRERRQQPLQADPLTTEKIGKAFQRILAEQAAGRPEKALAIQAEADQALIELARVSEQSESGTAAARVCAVLRAIEETFYEPWTLDQAARRAHLSRRRFSQLFRKLTGNSFLAQLNRLRVENGANLIKEGKQTIAAAAFLSGFGDLSQFYRHFRSHFGAPPGQWLNERSGPDHFAMEAVANTQ